MIIKTKSEKETVELGRKIAAKLNPGDVIALKGGLGAGKTYLTKGITEGMEAKSAAKSPTFVIINEYKGGKMPVYHFDCYRIRSLNEIVRLGYEEYFEGSGVTVVEWADKIRELLPGKCISIKIDISGEKERVLDIEGLRI